MSSQVRSVKTPDNQSSSGSLTEIDLAAKLIAEPRIREELQSWIDEIAASGSPWVHYLKARQMGLLSDQFRIVDLALATGLVRLKERA